MRNILVSILIPFYNSSNYMHISLESIFKQTYNNYEIICLDDGSTDNTYWKLLEYQKRYPKMKVYKNKKNSRLSYCRNKLISLANGDYFVFLDSDDYMSPDAIELLVNNSKKGFYDIVTAKTWVLINHKKLKTKTKVPFIAVSNTIENKNKYKYVKRNICTAWLHLIKKEYWNSLNVKFLENCDFEDFGLMPYVFLNCRSMNFINKRLYFYQRRPASLSDFSAETADRKIKDLLKQFNNLVSLFFNGNQLTEYRIRRSLNGIWIINLFAVFMMRFRMKRCKKDISEIDKLIYETLEKNKIKLNYSKTWWKSLIYFYSSCCLFFEFKKIRKNKKKDLKGLIFHREI